MTARFQINHFSSLRDVESDISWVKPVPLDRVGLSCLSGMPHFRLPGGQTGFTQVDISSYDYSSNSLKIWRGSVSDWLQKTKMAQAASQTLDNIVSARPDFAGLDMSATHLMGVVNVTPDSFSDGGQYLEREAAISHANALLSQGASIIDIGGESTRPGAAKITIDEERQRVIPVTQALSKRNILVSVDTRNPEIMRTALLEGATIINDVSGFRNKNVCALSLMLTKLECPLMLSLCICKVSQRPCKKPLAIILRLLIFICICRNKLGCWSHLGFHVLILQWM